MLPGRHMPQPMLGSGVGEVAELGSSSGLILAHQINMFEGNPHNQFNEMNQSTPHNEMPRIRDDELGEKSGSENLEGTASGDDQILTPHARKKRFHRHTQHQIQEMEAFFRECPHPDDKQRKELGRELGLVPLQVKFWFQNKRTQMKNQHERHENSQLRAENDKLRAENLRYKEALASSACPNCGGPTGLGDMCFDEHYVRIENARLREEIDKISGIAAKYVGKPMVPYTPLISPQTPSRSHDIAVGHFGDGESFGGGDLLRSVSEPSDTDKPLIIELAVAAMEELIRMGHEGEPLWVPQHKQGTNETADEVLNEDAYVQNFPRRMGPKPSGFHSEASRHSAMVIMNHTTLVRILMDVDQWSTTFWGIVSSATTLEVLSTGVGGNYDGALQVMAAEIQLPSPVVPTRESLFLRYSKQHDSGTWVVVDVSLEHLRPNPTSNCLRKPSGCLIKEMPNGYSKVIWVEHVEVAMDHKDVHDLYKPLIKCGLPFGAKCWVAKLERHCERLASLMASNIPFQDAGAVTSAEGRKSMMKLAKRIVLSFCSGVGASTGHTWATLSGSGAEDVRVMTRKSVDDPGRPPGIVLSAATSFWIPVSPKRVFDFLRDENSRSEWDILSNNGVVQEVAHIANGRDPGNCVSLLRVTSINSSRRSTNSSQRSTNSSESEMLILQESCTDETGSFVIYAPVDIVSMNVVLKGGDPDCVPVLPSGFAILPGGNRTDDGGGTPEIGKGGSLLTVAFQILVDSEPTAKLSLGSVATVNNLISCTVERIKAAIK